MTPLEKVEYLARMEGMTLDAFMEDRKGEPKAIDKLRLFYLAQHFAQTEAQTR